MVQIPLIKDALSFYYELNSDSHGYKHLDEVYELSVKIRDQLNLGISDHVLMCAAYTHDMFSSINREHHHSLAQKWVRDTNVFFLNELAPHERHLVSCAVGEHRASYEGAYSSVLSEVLSAADRGIPDLYRIVRRVYQCAMEPDSVFKYDDDEELAKNGLTHKLGLTRTAKHLKDKYSSTGYARYNAVYAEVFGDKLKELREAFDSITEDKIQTIFDNEEYFRNKYSLGDETMDEAVARMAKVHNGE